MTTRTTPFAAGTPCWVDLFTSDVEKSKAFYSELLGWTPVDAGPDFGGYVNFHSDGHTVAGLMANTDPAQNGPDRWNTYISSDDIDKTVTSAVEEGGSIVMPAMAVGDIGSMAVIQDPVGGFIGIWQPGVHTGFQKYNEPGSVAWDEYHSKDFAVSTPFYAKVFGWDLEPTSDTDDFRYYTGNVNGEVVAGLMDSKAFLPEQVPSHWTVYFSVANVDESVEKAVALGGTVMRPAEDTPFGRLVDMADPTGAMFKMMQLLS